jgi:formylglycine-generating enzyme required for sulfatase activity
MVGSVWHWTRTVYKDYPYWLGDGREALHGIIGRALRGGSAYMSIEGLTCAYRFAADPDHEHNDAGFRVVVAPDPSVL